MDRFIFMLEWETPVQQLTNEEKGILFQNLINYASGIQLDETNRQVNIAWGFMQPNIDRMTDKYQKDVENGKRGGAPKGTKPWNKKESQSEPLANPQQTPSEGKQTYKEKYKEKEKYNKKENSNESSITYFSANTETHTNSTHTRVEKLKDFFKPFEQYKKPELILDNLDASTRKEADRQAELELEKLLNKNL